MRYARRTAAILLAVVAVTSGLTAAFASITTITPVADSFVLLSAPDDNRGGSSVLRINDDVKRAYFRFNVSGLPPGESVTGAVLRVFATSGAKCSTGAQVFRAANDTWTESNITWNNQPGTIGPAVAGAPSWTANRWVNFNVSSAVDGAGAISFVLRHAPGCTVTSDATFESRESTRQPRLVIQTAPSPFPQCSDGVDNDSDGKTDFPEDPGCTDASDNNETDPPLPPTCGVSNDHTLCVTLPSATLSGNATITVTNSPNNGELFLDWVPNGAPPRYLRETFTRDPVTNDYSFMWPTHKYLDATGRLRFRAGSASSTPVDVPVTIDNGNVTDYQHNPSDWENFLPGPWMQPTNPVIPVVGDGPSDEGDSNRVAAAIDQSNPPLALFLGDIYEQSTHTELVNNYGVSALDSPSPTLWGAFANVTQPVLGNHEISNVDDWTDYWHGRPRFTSYTFGGVLFLALDSSGPSAFLEGTEQYEFVQSELSSAPPCVVAYAHHPVLTGSQVNSSKLPMWQLLAQNGADVYLVAHAHFMTEYQALNADLQPGPGAHLVEMISGAGGHNLGPAKSDSRIVFSQGDTPGVLYLTLQGARNGGTATSLSWEWKNANGGSLSTGSTSC